MKQSDLIALDFKLKHARSKKKIIDLYPELRGKTVPQVIKLIQVNTMILTGKSFKQQIQLQRKKGIIYGRRTF
jgi:hypothetical protein